MWTFLGFVAVCSLMSPSEVTARANPSAVLFVVSPAIFEKYVSNIFLKDGLFKSHVQAFPFPPGSPPAGKELGNSIWGLHIVKVHQPTVSVELKANSTVQVLINVRLLFSAQYHFSRLFESLDFTVDVHFRAIRSFWNYSVGTVRLKTKACNTQVTIAKIISPSYLIRAQVRPLIQNILTATLPGALCQAEEVAAYVALYNFLYTANVLLPLHSAASLQYQLATLPLTTPDFFLLPFRLFIRTPRHTTLLPASSHTANIPSLNGHDLCLVFTQDALNHILSVMIRLTPQEFITTPQAFSGSVQLIDAVAVLLSHQECPKCPEKSPLKILLQVVEAISIILQPSGYHIQLSLKIGVASKDPLGALTDLFVLKAKLRLNVDLSVHENRLIFHTTLSKVELHVVSSEIGQFHVTSLTTPIHLLLVEMLVPRINDSLDGGIPVPSLLNVKVDYPRFLVLPSSLALCI
ncbi:BPI fold-containing family B member 3-like [Paroedura picta]|uniref:BPI fold-containing family B member 3-like n=1 Tax=Paroedura picta TaxID=143630 RepID=UPI004055D3FF